MPSFGDIVSLFQHMGTGAVVAAASFLAALLGAIWRGMLHTDREFQREVDRGDKWEKIATDAVDTTKDQQRSLDNLTGIVEKLTDQLGRFRT